MSPPVPNKVRVKLLLAICNVASTIPQELDQQPGLTSFTGFPNGKIIIIIFRFWKQMASLRF